MKRLPPEIREKVQAVIVAAVDELRPKVEGQPAADPQIAAVMSFIREKLWKEQLPTDCFAVVVDPDDPSKLAVTMLDYDLEDHIRGTAPVRATSGDVVMLGRAQDDRNTRGSVLGMTVKAPRSIPLSPDRDFVVEVIDPYTRMRIWIPYDPQSEQDAAFACANWILR